MGAALEAAAEAAALRHFSFNGNISDACALLLPLVVVIVSLSTTVTRRRRGGAHDWAGA